MNTMNKFTLPSGIEVSHVHAKARHAVEAQKIIGQETEKLIVAIISLTCEFDGKALPIDDILEFELSDYFKLMEVFGGNFNSAPSK